MRTWLLAVALLTSCGQNDNPAGAKSLYSRVTTGAGYRSWPRAPGFASRKPSFTEHGDAVEIFVNPSIANALAGPDPVTSYPAGSIIVKESFSNNTKSSVAAMEKRADGWFWAEYSADGKPLYSGRPTVCIDCHDNRQHYSDWVYAFELPR